MIQRVSQRRMVPIGQVFLMLVLLVSLVVFPVRGAQAQVPDQGGPVLDMSGIASAQKGETVVVPITFSSRGHDVGGLMLALDFEPTCLAFNTTDNNHDGIPDAVELNVPDTYYTEVTYDTNDVDAELDIVASHWGSPDIQPLKDGVLARVTFTVVCDQAPSSTLVKFSGNPGVSLGGIYESGLQATTYDPFIVVIRDSNNTAPVDDMGQFTCTSQFIDILGVGVPEHAANQKFIVPTSVQSFIQVGETSTKDNVPIFAIFEFLGKHPIKVFPTQSLLAPPDITPDGLRAYLFETMGTMGYAKVVVPGTTSPHRTSEGIFVYYPKPATVLQSGAMTTTFQYAWGGENNHDYVGPATLELTLPEPLQVTMDVHIKVALMDKDEQTKTDKRIVVLRAETEDGSTVEQVIENPDALRLNVEELILRDVPAGVDTVKLTVESPRNEGSQWNTEGAGDSVFLVGATIWHTCVDGNGTATRLLPEDDIPDADDADPQDVPQGGDNSGDNNTQGPGNGNNGQNTGGGNQDTGNSDPNTGGGNQDTGNSDPNTGGGNQDTGNSDPNTGGGNQDNTPTTGTGNMPTPRPDSTPTTGTGSTPTAGTSSTPTAGTSSTPTAGTGSTPTPDTGDNDQNTQTILITPGKGGTLQMNGIVLAFPTGAVENDTEIVYGVVAGGSPNNGNGRKVFHRFTLEAKTSEGEVTQFKKPYTLTVTYTDTEVLDLDIDEAALVIAYWDDDEGRWVSVLPSVVDTGANTVQAQLDHFTEFALLEDTTTRVYIPFMHR